MEDGIASVITTMTTGTSVEVGMIGLEGMVGAAGLLGAAVSTQYIVVQVAGTAARMSVARCAAAFEECVSFRRLFLRFLDTLFNFGAQTAACNRLHSVEQRCARWLLIATDRTQSDILPVTHEFLATMLGVRRSGVTEVAGELQRSGLIRYHHGRVTILDREGLTATACECYRLDRERLNRLM